jgi:hypothetical protein
MEEEQIKIPNPRGGHREGAGRPPKDGVGTEFVGVKLNKKHLQIIRDNYDNLSEFICKAVKEKLRREELL